MVQTLLKTPTLKVQSPVLKKKVASKGRRKVITADRQAKNKACELDFDDDIDQIKPYPRTVSERATFVNQRTGKRITPFQYRLYDVCQQIPKGKVTTYKILSTALNAHPRAVGQALRNNPFAPNPVPCHRIVASDGFVGGFSGQWGEGTNIDSKRAKLAKEGVLFDDRGYLLPDARKTQIFDGFTVEKVDSIHSM